MAKQRLPFAVAALALLAFAATPAGAEHPQTGTASDGSPLTVQFDHDGDNEWWVEVQARPLNGDGIHIMFARVEGDDTWYYMKFAANDYERQQEGWVKGAPNHPFEQIHVPPGKRVMFRADMHDADTGATGSVLSCWFTHPAGVEQCGDGGGTGFDAAFTGFRGNEWWVQANVASNGPSIAKVEVRVGEGAWKPLGKQSWGPTAWAGSHHFPPGSVLQMRATATDGRVDLSSCRQWIPPSGQDARIVPCPNVGFDATFSEVKGNEWWAQVKVTGSAPVTAVELRADCDWRGWQPLKLQSWGSWAASYHLPPGTKVEFRAFASDGQWDTSGAYLWTGATPTSSC